jgi:rhodanese-related sulfurtransferase
VQDLRQVFERLQDVQVVDCREVWEWQVGRIPSAIHIPLNQILAGGENGLIDAGKPVYVVCRSGNRSELASVMLRARGYPAENMEGGMEEWERLGLPFSAVDGSPGRVA